MSDVSLKPLMCICLLVLSIGQCKNLLAQDTNFEPVHWAYSAFFGTGWYQVRDNRSIFVLRIPPRQRLRESGFDDSGKREIGLEIQYPLNIGLHNIDDFQDFIGPDNFGTISFTPGVSLEIPINERWYLRPFANAGWGTEIDSSNSVWIYYTGIRSRYTFPGRKFEWALLNGLFYAGYSPDRGRSDDMAVAQMGVEVRHPLSTATVAGRAIDLHYNFMYSFLGNDLSFGLPDGDFDVVRDQFEAGIAVSFRNGPYELWFFKVHRLGIGYKFTSKGQFNAISLSMSSWFNG